jgi:hypothetical protein
MPQTITTLVPMLMSLGSVAGAGLLAFGTITWVRSRWTEDQLPAWLDQQFYAPGPTRTTAIVLSIVYSMLFTSLAAWLSGEPILGAADQALAGQIDRHLAGLIEAFMAGGAGFTISQIAHGAVSLPNDKSTERVNRTDAERLREYLASSPESVQEHESA